MISGYDPEAVRPVVGSLWAWEPDKPHAAALVQVTDVWWNGEEWWVGTLSPAVAAASIGRLRLRPDINELDRFWEAVHGIMVRPGPVQSRRGLTRSGRPLPEELKRAAAPR